MPLGKIWNVRADTTWISLVQFQALQTGRSSPGVFVRDLVWLLSRDSELFEQVVQRLRGVRYGN